MPKNGGRSFQQPGWLVEMCNYMFYTRSSKIIQTEDILLWMFLHTINCIQGVLASFPGV